MSYPGAETTQRSISLASLGRLTLLVGMGSTLLNLGMMLPVVAVVMKPLDALAQSPPIDPRQLEAKRLLQQGVEHYYANQFEAALRSWQQALSLYRELKNRWGEGNALNNVGAAYEALGNYPQSIDYYQQSLVIRREVKDLLGERESLNNLGEAYFRLGDYQKVIEYQQQSLALRAQLYDRPSEGKALRILGNAYHALGDYPKAIEYLKQSLVIAREIKDRRDEGGSLNSLGLVYDRLGDYRKAIEYYQQALVINREIKDRLSEGSALNNLGLAYSGLGDYPKAIEYLQQSLAMARELKYRRSEGDALNNLGLAYGGLGNNRKAIEYYQQALAISRAIKDRLGEGNSLNNLGAMYDNLKDYPKAIEYYQQALELRRTIKDRLGEGSTLNNLGAAFFDLGQFSKAESILLESIQVYESLRQGLQDTQKVSLAEIQRSPYNTLQQVLIAQKKIGPALEIAERGRARAFAELLAQRTRGKAQLTIQPIRLAAIQQIAREQKATLVEYTNIDNEQLFIWVVKPTGNVTFRQVDLKPLRQQKTSIDNLIHAARCLGATNCEQAVASRGSQPFIFDVAQGDRQFSTAPSTRTRNQYLQRLHQLLIAPIADLLPTRSNERVIFIPQGTQFLAPFAALQDEQGQYLIEKQTISIAPSIQVLQLTRQQRQRPTQNSHILLVGNPAMPFVSSKPGEPAQQLPSLPGAEREANAISKLFKISALVGQQATETTVRNLMAKARIIHLATHGLLGDFGGLGIPGAIALAPTASDDGLLTADELLTLKLQAELAVLSACDTGQGKITGDGVIGLSRSLITSGVPSIIVSLWAVPDAPTADLMTYFYQNLQQGQNKAQALRQAMLETQKDFPDPRAWAAFTLIGEAE